MKHERSPLIKGTKYEKRNKISVVKILQYKGSCLRQHEFEWGAERRRS